jgi:hypothetical protein
MSAGSGFADGTGTTTATTGVTDVVTTGIAPDTTEKGRRIRLTPDISSSAVRAARRDIKEITRRGVDKSQKRGRISPWQS